MSHYTPLEERFNVLSHVAGLALSIAGFVFLLVKASTVGNLWHVVSFGVFGASLIILYAASTIYHSATDASHRARMRVFDHAAIYILIAGTYTPFTLITLQGPVGWTLFSVIWGMAAVGVTLKLFFTGRYDLISTSMYVFMGWVMIFAIGPLIDSLPGQGMTWLFAGGIAYTLGAVCYSIPKLPFGHGVFHVFVLCGSICHFASVYWFVLPSGNS